MKHHEKCIHHGSILLADGTECPCDCHMPKSLSEKLLRLTKSELINLIIKIQLESQEEIWEYHTLSDNFGMTLEQSKKVNEIIKEVHNTAYKEIIKTIKNYIEKII